MSSLLASRRSFLKLFGATVAAVALPVEQIPMLSAVVKPEQVLPPNVLHIFQKGVWHSVSEILRMKMESEWQKVEIRSNLYGFGGEGPWYAKGMNHTSAKIDLVRRPTISELLSPIFYGAKTGKFAISLSGCVYEFEAAMMSANDILHENCEAFFQTDMEIVGKVEYKLLEDKQ